MNQHPVTAMLILSASCAALAGLWTLARKFRPLNLRRDTQHKETRSVWLRVADRQTATKTTCDAAALFAMWLFFSYYRGEFEKGVAFVLITSTIGALAGIGILQVVAWAVRQTPVYRRTVNRT